jgi:hypothetical protein
MVTAAHIAVMGAHIVIVIATVTAFPIAGTGARTTRTVTDPVQRSLPSVRDTYAARSLIVNTALMRLLKSSCPRACSMSYQSSPCPA